MSFLGKATFSAGATLPEIAEDVSDLVGLVSPHETPLLDLLGDSARSARSTVHEWLEDGLLSNSTTITTASLPEPQTVTTFDVADASLIRPGDQIQLVNGQEVMLVTSVSGSTLTVVRGYGASTPQNLAPNLELRILGHAALEGADAPEPRFTTRLRRQNFTQIFTAAVEVSGSELAVSQLAVDDELDYQKTARLRELLRDLENTVLNGRAPTSNPQGTASTRRTMKGILAHLSTNAFNAGEGLLQDVVELTEPVLNQVLRQIWEKSAGQVDTIVVAGAQKRRINGFITPSARTYTPRSDTWLDRVAVYESDFGVCDVVLSRWMPQDAVLFLDRSRLSVLPLAGRSFHYLPLAVSGDRRSGQLIGEYTLELRNEQAHGVIRGLTV